MHFDIKTFAAKNMHFEKKTASQRTNPESLKTCGIRTLQMITCDFSLRKNASMSDYLAESIKTQITDGELKGNEKLPSKRALASRLGISVITVQNAYYQLISEGYIYSIEKKGFFVEDIDPIAPPRKMVEIKKNAEQVLVHAHYADFVQNSTCHEKFPFSTWTKVSRSILKKSPEMILAKMPPSGIPELQHEICMFLKDFRNMHVKPEQIIIGAGTEVLYDMIVKLLGTGRKYAVENPGYKKICRILNMNGAECIPVSLDGSGIDMDNLEKTGAKIVHVTPSHHFPTGIAMPVKRRSELLKWLESSKEHIIIEDDYDSEFRFSGKPLKTIQSSDTTNKVIYINTFSKTLAPSFRISFMILPPPLLLDFKNNFSFHSCTVSAFEQYTLAEFMAKGFYASHIIKMKNYYKSLRNNFIAVLQGSRLKDRFKIYEEDSGLHFLLEFKTNLDGMTLQKLFLDRDIKISLLRDYFYSENSMKNFSLSGNTIDASNTFVVNYSGIERKKITEIIRRMEEAILSGE